MALTRVEHYDVVIVGAGLVGASLALALLHDSPHKARILLIEASPIQSAFPEQPGFDMRSTVLSAGTASYFRELGLWYALEASAEPITSIHVSDQGHFGTVRLEAEQEGVAALGHVVENAALGRALNGVLLETTALEICAPARVTGIEPCIQGMRLNLQREVDASELTAALVVLAEGNRSGLCAQLGIAHRRQSYEQSAVIANVGFTKPHRQVAYERFTSKGPLALLPLSDHAGQHRAALVWTHPAADADGILALSDTAFLQHLQRDFGHRVGVFRRVGKRAAYPLSLEQADEQIRPGLVLLGNVAHSLHPVAGQGFNLALRDTMMLAHNIRESLRLGQSPGGFARLSAYREAVRQDQTWTVGFSDYMTRLFSSSNPTLALARKFGMASIDLLPPLKHRLSRQAMGLGHPRVNLS